MPFEISDDESAAIVRSIKAGSIIDSDKEIIQKFMDRVSSKDNSTPVSNEENSKPDSTNDGWYGMYPGDDYSGRGGKKQRTSKRRNSKKRRSNKRR
jgi:hypothetical protein